MPSQPSPARDLADANCVEGARLVYSMWPGYLERVPLWANGFNESFNGKLRDELLNGEIFYTLKEAEVLIE